MNALIRKETRLLLWPWIGAMLLSTVPGWLYLLYRSTVLHGGRGMQQSNDFPLDLAIYCFGVGIFVLALIPFGQEFTFRTFANVLSQPIDRKQLWRTKLWLLILSTLACTAALLISSQFLANHCWSISQSVVGNEIHQEIHPLSTAAQFWIRTKWALLIAAIACSGGLWTTLVFRNMAAALCVTLMAPLVVMFLENWITLQFPPRIANEMLPWSLWAYAIAATIFARWYFLRAQDIANSGAAIVVSPRIAQGLITFRRTNRYWAVIKKEFQLQQVSFWMAACIAILHLASFVPRSFKSTHPTTQLWYLIDNVWLLWIAIPFIIGCSIVAEERRLGTLEPSLTQPVARFTQLLIKIIFGLATAVVLGAVLPVGIERLWSLIGPTNQLVSWLVGINDFAVFAKGPLAVTACAMFVSMFSRNTIEAVYRALILIPAIFALGALLTSYRYGLPLLELIVIPAALWLSWKNFQCIQVRTRDVTVSFLVLCGCCLTAWGAASFTYNRAWELFSRLEPKHGPAVITAGARVKVFSSESGPLALLPDGRIWRADYNEHLSDHVKTLFHTNRIFAPSDFEVKNPGFLPGSDWTDLAVAGKAFALKSNGTLWEVNPSVGTTNGTTIEWRASAPRQFGSDTNWVQIVGGMVNQFLALKSDGTLWGWGPNWFRELGPGPTQVDKAKPVWPDDRWSKVFMCGSICFGFKTDATACRWGYVPKDYNSVASLRTSYPSPTPSPFPGTNWTTFYASSTLMFGLKNDGTVWYVAPPRGYNWDHVILGQSITNCTEPMLFDPSSKWRAITTHPPLSGIKISGEWRLAAGHWIGRDDIENILLSRYTDWLAISAEDGVIGLAADGTISCWLDVDRDSRFVASRRPTWSINIFATR